MAKESGVHAYTDWAKGRLDEMDATVSSMEAHIKELQARGQANAEAALAEMKAKRDAFSAEIDKSRASGEAAWADIVSQMQANWSAFETATKNYMDSATEVAEQNRLTWQTRAEEQMKSWQASLDQLQNAAKEFSGERKVDLENAIDKMKSEGDSARARLDSLSQAGTQSWSAMMKALSESRAAFETANTAAFEAMKRAMK